MKDLLEFIVKSLVDDPIQVQVSEAQSGYTVLLELRVAPEDMGRVIGKGGRVINSIRTLLRLAAAREGRRVEVELA
ncbi:MAG: KH domain-containing protein [Chloroflexi bacterium]|nr:KH domain-containing protein [Chloroflexota bacterium]MBI3762022.1 KH domain-containing protein [Chloroflexota bacterium]